MMIRQQEDRKRRNTMMLCGAVLGTIMLIALFNRGGASGPGGTTVANRDAYVAAFEPDLAGPELAELNPPHGGKIMDLVRTGAELEALKKEALPLPSLQLNDRQMCDIELLLSGGFSPLDGFMDETTFKMVVEKMRLPSGLVWPMPITLDVDPNDASIPEETRAALHSGGKIAIRDPYYNLLAVMDITDVYEPNKLAECQNVFGTTDESHPGVDYVMNKAKSHYVGGKLRGTQLPSHYDFKDMRRTPAQLRSLFNELGWRRIVAFQTRNPMHRAHIELTKQSAAKTGANILIQPVVGMTQPGDIDYSTRVRCYKAIINKDIYYKPNQAIISLFSLAMRMAGPREALWHALIRKNFGASHFIIGRDHAGCKSAAGDDFYGPDDAQLLVKSYTDEIGVRVVLFQKQVYVEELDSYFPEDKVPAGYEGKSISGTEVRRRLRTGEEIPAWFSDPDVVALLRTVYPPMSKRGFTLFFTGLSGSGKTTIAHALMPVLNEYGTRKITLLDGDVTRTYLTKDLGFSPEDRNTNVRRVGYVASEITKYGGIAIISAIAPYEESRQDVRELCEANGGFIMVYMSTSVEECARRDPKGLYDKAKAGILKGFTGVSPDAPFYPPKNPEINIDGELHSIDDSVDIIVRYLVETGYLPYLPGQEPTA